jgi:hypothetical protein
MGEITLGTSPKKTYFQGKMIINTQKYIIKHSTASYNRMHIISICLIYSTTT